MLDVLSERGQESVAQEDRAIEIFESAYSNMRFVRTRKDSPAALDGVILHKGDLFAVAEVKCRNLRLDELLNKYDGEWLLSWDKVEAGLQAFRLLNVGMVGLLYLVPDDVVLLVRIVDAGGFVYPPMRFDATETRRTINGGSVLRNNCYIDITGAAVLRMGA